MTEWYHNPEQYPGDNEADLTTVEARATVLEAADVVHDADIVTLQGAAFSSRTVAVGHADLTEAGNGVAEAVSIGAVLPAGAVVVAHEVDITTLFSGGTVSAVTAEVGGTDVDAIVNDVDVFTGALTGKLDGAAGVHTSGLFSAEQLVVTFTPDGGNPLVDLDAGALDVTVWFFVP